MSGRGGCAGSAGAGTEGSGSSEGFSGPALLSSIGVFFSSSGSNTGGVTISLLLLLWAASLSAAPCGALPHASSTSGVALGLAGGVREGKGLTAGGSGFKSGPVVGSSLFTPLCRISFSTSGFETQRERGVSSDSTSPFMTAE